MQCWDQKEVPSRSGGIEVVLTTLCPLLVKKGNFVTCYNRSHEKSEEEYKEIQGRKEYKGVSLKKVWTLNRNGLSAVTASFSAAILAAIEIRYCTFSCRGTSSGSLDT